jgi:uncharacterized DUF497 family protein
MEIVWDAVKRRANLAKHGLDFADLDMAFFATALLRPGHSGRILAIGRHGKNLVVAVVFRPLGREALSIISLRPASARERELLDG